MSVNQSDLSNERGIKVKARLVVAVLLLATIAAFGAKHTDFSGSWELSPDKSRNIGMMSQMKMTQTIEQSDGSLDVVIHTNFQGRDGDSKTHYDLTGKPAKNEAPMAGPAETISKWQDAALVTTWTSESAVAGGPKVVRTETRSLSPDGRTMTIESVRGTSPATVMVFDRK
jgi:hypothetical protein